MGFKENLKGELEYSGIPVKELAHRTGIPKQTIDKYLLSNSSMPPADKAVKIAQILGVSVEYLVTGSKNSNIKTQNIYLSPKMRAINECIKALSFEELKIIETAVAELVKLLRHPMKNEATSLTPLQKVFLHLFR